MCMNTKTLVNLSTNSESFKRSISVSGFVNFCIQTRMHSSRMRTVRYSGCWGRGCVFQHALGGGVCVSQHAQGGVCPGGCLSEGCLPRGVSVQESGLSALGGCPPPPPVNRITNGCEDITLPQHVAEGN